MLRVWLDFSASRANVFGRLRLIGALLFILLLFLIFLRLFWCAFLRSSVALIVLSLRFLGRGMCCDYGIWL